MSRPIAVGPLRRIRRPTQRPFPMSLLAVIVLAQPPAQTGITVSRSWGAEILISLAFVGLALFAVCRRSNRQ